LEIRYLKREKKSPGAMLRGISRYWMEWFLAEAALINGQYVFGEQRNIVLPAK